MDGDERRRRSLEAGREMLEKYKIERARKLLRTDIGQVADFSDAESVLNELSMERRESCVQEGLSSRDMTQSSISMSEGEGDGDLVLMAGRVAKLEEELQGKEVIVEALSAELDQLKGEPSSPNSSQSQTSSAQGINVVSLYQYKEFEEAVKSRDCLIEQLSNSLKTALETRDELVARLKVLSSQIPNKDNRTLEEDNINLQEKVATLEIFLKDKDIAIHQLNAQLDTRNAEINNYKLQINGLNEQIRAAEKDLQIAETLEQQKQYEQRVEKIKQEMQNIAQKFSDEMEVTNNHHKKELKDLAEKHDLEVMNIHVHYKEQLKLLQENNKMLQDRVNKELPELEIKHAKELSAFQLQLVSYKTTVETLKKELVNHAESQKTAQAELNVYKGKLEELSMQAERTRRVQELNFQKEKEMLMGQIDLHKTQLEDITSKYLSISAVLESKESIERTLEQTLMNANTLKQDNEILRFKLDDLSSRYSAAQSLIENSQQHERSLSNRIFDLEKSLSRVSGINVSTVSELNETTYQTFNEIAMQYEMTRQTLEEKQKMEQVLTEKVRRLEEDVIKSTKELEEANLTKRSYEKQLKDMKNMCDKLKTEVETLTHKNAHFNDSERSGNTDEDRKSLQSDSLNDLRIKVTSYEQQISQLKILLEKRDHENSEYTKELKELQEKMKRSEEERDHLKNGLAIAYAQCAEVQEKLNQTLALNDTRTDSAQNASSFDMSLLQQIRAQDYVDHSVIVASSVGRQNLSLSVKDNSTEVESITGLQTEFASLKKENDDLKKELKSMLENQGNNEEITRKLHDYKELCDRLENEKLELLEENLTLKKKQEVLNSLRQCVNQLKKERDFLHTEMKNLVDSHREEVNAIRTDSIAKIQKVQMLLDAKSSNKVVEDMKAELEARHAREMSELRQYFEQHCQQIEKQYSEEIYSQQSKKMSDNDSEIEELTDDLYIGGAGDCLEISNVPDRSPENLINLSEEAKEKNHRNSKADSPLMHEKYEVLGRVLQETVQAKESEIQEIRKSYEEKIQHLDELHKEELKKVKENHGMTVLLTAVNQHCQTEWDAEAVDNGAYSHQLEEQVAQAKVDILNALQERIQALLAGEDDWPTELLQIRDKFTSNAKRELEELKDIHSREVLRLKEEHSEKLAMAVERYQQEIEQMKAKLASGNHFKENEILRERNMLNKTCATLKDLVNELIKYFVTCEEELNNTLISEVLKRQSMENVDSNKDEDTRKIAAKEKNVPDNSNASEFRIKRVHFAPQISEIVSVINSDQDVLQNMLDSNQDVTAQFRKELRSCLQRLKSDSAQILGTSSSESQSNENPDDVEWSGTVNEDLQTKLSHAENVIMRYREESEALKIQILDLQRKLANAESKKEIISEGYGEHDESGAGGDVLLQDFSQLQEKARHVLSNGGGDCSYLLQIIEEFCTQNERLIEETRKEKEDLQQEVPLEPTPPPIIHRVCCRKIEAADKQLKVTRKFLEEQASERDAERDESARHIQRLEEQLKERERDKERDLRISSEATLSPEPPSDTAALRAAEVGAAVEALEAQMREMVAQMADIEERKAKTEDELKAAVDKIWMLREIITELEQQIQAKIETEDALQVEISQLNTVIAVQTKNQQELVQELDAIKMGSENSKLNEHINDLQEELRKHKLSTEHFTANSSALKQMKVELREMQTQLDKRTKELEALHMCGSNLSISQPSEDVSIRDQIDATRCPTPDDPIAPPMLPLDQVLKVKEKLSKHARAEEVVFKRMKDLEMQINALKNQNEELLAEQEILQQTASEQLFQIEAMRGRLEQQKQSAPFAQRQATSRLELQLHEANAKFQSLEQIIADKDLELKDLRSQLERTNQMLAEKEAEIASVVQFESKTIQKLKERLQSVEEERRILESKLGHQEQAQMELPKLLDTMLADKNEEIDHLKEQLSKKEKQLEIYSSAALDEVQFRELAKQQAQSEPKNSARTLSDILSIHSECEDVCEAIRALPTSSRIMPHNASTLRIPVSSTAIGEVDSTGLLDANKESIEVPLLDLGSQSPTFSISGRRNSCISLGMDLLSPPENTNHDAPTDGKSQPSKTGGSSSSKSSCPKHGSKSNEIEKPTDGEVKAKVQELEAQLNEIKANLEAKSATLDLRESELLTLQRNLEELQVDFKETVDTLTRDKYFYKNQYELSQVSEGKIKKDLEEVENALKLKIDELQDYKSKMQTNEKIIMELNNENTKLRRSAEDNDGELARKYGDLLEMRAQEIKSLKDSIFEKDVTIETIQTRNIEIENENKQLYEFKTKFEQCRQELVACKNEIQRLTEGLNNRDQIIRRLEEMARRTSLSGASSPSDEKDQEIHHLQEYIKEKDKVIRQMSDDSKSLQKALETIQNKMKESGNVVELRRKLKDERRMNAELRSTVEKLRRKLEESREQLASRSQDDTDIEDMVQRELNLSATLDRQIMNAIESDPEEELTNGLSFHSRHSRSDHDQQDNVAQKYLDAKLRLKQSSKINEELNKLKDDLEIERDMLKAQIAEYEERILQIKSDFEEECKKVAKLDGELSFERSVVRNLKIQLDKEQKSAQLSTVRQAEVVEFLHEKLRSSMENEERLHNDISTLRQEHQTLEKQLCAVREEMIQSQNSDKSSQITDLLVAEQKKYVTLAEEYETERKSNAELRATLKKVESEKNRYEKQLAVVEEEKEKYVSSLVLAESIKEHLEIDLRRTREELKTREKECQWLEKRIETMTAAETERQRQVASEHGELKVLRREVNNAREVMMDLEADMQQSRRELAEAIQRELKLGESLERLKERETELTRKLAASRDEEKRLKETLAEFQQNLTVAARREVELARELAEGKSANDRSSLPRLTQKVRELNETNERQAQERTALHERLSKLREERERLAARVRSLEGQLALQTNRSPESANPGSREMSAKLQHFYGKYLRVESRRKALIYQKRYLLCIVGGYQISEENTLSVLARLTQSQRAYASKGRSKNPRVRFRSAALVVVSIVRMKWLIVRWRVGKRVGANTLLDDLNRSFVPVQRPAPNHSPPVRERGISNEEDALGRNVLAQYFHRLQNIQQNMGLALGEPSTARVHPD